VLNSNNNSGSTRVQVSSRRILLAFTLVTLILMALAFPTVLSAESIDSRLYRLAPGDRITVTVFGQPELSGEFLIDDAGTIAVPLADPIEVKDLTMIECQKRIGERLADGILRKPSVSVRIAELRPLYVLGDVRLPGAYPFRFGSTVQSAVALAGGFGPAEALRNVVVSEFLTAEERVRQLTLQQHTLLVRKARLEAQRDGKESFSPPTFPDEPESKDVLAIVANEVDQFTAQRAILEDQIETIRSLKPHLEEEIQANTEQANAGKKQLDLIRQQIERYEKIFRQGLGTQNNDFQYRVLEANQEATVWRSLSEVSRFQLQLQELDSKVRELEAAFRRQVAAELQQTLDRLQELKVTLPGAIRIRDLKRQYAGGAAQDGMRSIVITRTRNGQPVVLGANETTSVEPGDVIEIKNEIPRIPPHDEVAAGPPSPWASKTDAAQPGRVDATSRQQP
jgi:polysaccharide biosynthesis/export protein